MSDTDFYGIGADQGFMVPVFEKPLSADQASQYTNLVGLISRNLELAFTDVVDFRIYSSTDAYKSITLSSEFSLLSICYLPGSGNRHHQRCFVIRRGNSPAG